MERDPYTRELECLIVHLFLHCQIQFHIRRKSINLNSILWTDESKFTNNGVINKQNNRYWDDKNPH